MPKVFIKVLLGILILLLLVMNVKKISWSILFHQIETTHPEVVQLSTDELYSWLSDSNKTPPLVFDTRTKPEFEMSHLKDAQFYESEKLASISKDTPVVLYCSVGVRSTKIAAELHKKGFSKVWNLKGSIFKWANEGKPFVATDSTKEKIHPYNKFWGILLDKHYYPSNYQVLP